MTIFSSNNKSLFILQCSSILLILFGIILGVNFNIYYLLLSICMFYVYSIFGISMMLHRYYTHKSFELHPAVKYFFTLFAILAGRGSPLGWTYIHRIHHGFSDTEKDPHSPHFSSFNFIGFRPVQDPTKKINYFIIKDLMNPIQLKIDKYYLLIIITFLLLLFMIDYSLVLYAWALPVFTVSITQTLFNYFAHMQGYRNFETNDKSTNNIFLWPFILGDAWHNNHHHAANKLSTKIRSFEFDPIVGFINIISKKNV